MNNTVIACLGWGSLIWDPRDLPVHPKWHKDGPMISVEFLRKSDNKEGRLTLVLDPSGKTPKVRSLWAVMDATDLKSATKALQKREGTTEKLIEYWESNKDMPEKIKGLSEWAKCRGVDAVIWTGLTGNLGKEDPVEYLKTLAYHTGKRAEEYVRKTPPQIDTPFRRRFEKELGWTHLTTS